MPAMLDSLVQAARDGVHNAAASTSGVLASESTAMPSLRTLSKIALGGAQVVLNGGRVMGTYTQTCPNAQLSCHNSTAVADLCCFNAVLGHCTSHWAQ
jgi:ribonuclease T2